MERSTHLIYIQEYFSDLSYLQGRDPSPGGETWLSSFERVELQTLKQVNKSMVRKCADTQSVLFFNKYWFEGISKYILPAAEIWREVSHSSVQVKSGRFKRCSGFYRIHTCALLWRRRTDAFSRSLRLQEVT